MTRASARSWRGGSASRATSWTWCPTARPRPPTCASTSTTWRCPTGPRPGRLGQRGGRVRLDPQRRPPRPAALQPGRRRSADRDRPRRRLPDHAAVRASPAAKVAAVATAAIAAVYVIGAIALNLALARHMTDQNDARLADKLSAARRDPAALSQPPIRDRRPSGPNIRARDADSPPAFLRSADPPGRVTRDHPRAPPPS